MFRVMVIVHENDEPISTSVYYEEAEGTSDWETEAEAIAEAEALVEDYDCWEAWVKEV